MKRLREAKGWSQEALADRSGLHRTYISGVERGVRNPTVSVLQKIAVGLETTMTELVCESEPVVSAMRIRRRPDKA